MARTIARDMLVVAEPCQAKASPTRCTFESGGMVPNVAPAQPGFPHRETQDAREDFVLSFPKTKQLYAQVETTTIIFDMSVSSVLKCDRWCKCECALDRCGVVVSVSSDDASFGAEVAPERFSRSCNRSPLSTFVYRLYSTP